MASDEFTPLLKASKRCVLFYRTYRTNSTFGLFLVFIL